MEPKVIDYSRYELKMEIAGEGHSFCNLLRRTLLEEEAVEFAGYNIDHPLLASPVFTLKTQRRQTNTVLRDGLEKMLARTEEFREKLVQAVKDYEVD